VDLNSITCDLNSPSTEVERQGEVTAQPGDQLRRLCLGLAQFLNPNVPDEYECLPHALHFLRSEAERQLTPVLQSVLQSLSGKLRQELKVLQHVVDDLEQLSGNAKTTSEPPSIAYPPEFIIERQSVPDESAKPDSRPLQEFPTRQPPTRMVPTVLDSEVVSDARTAEPSLSFETLEHRAQLYAKEGDWENAIDASGEALKLNPISTKSLFIRGAAYFRTGENYRALADLNRLINQDPLHVLAHNERGAVNACLQRFDKALDDYATVIRLKPQLTIARFNRGLVLLAAGKLDLALTTFNGLAEVWPEKAAVFFHRGRIHYLQNEPAKAIADFQTALEIDPEFPNAEVRLQEAQELLEHKEEGPRFEVVPEDEPPLSPPKPEVAAPKPILVDASNRSHLTITCNGCGSSRQVPFDRLNRQYKCQKCHRIYFISQSGNLVEIKPPEKTSTFLLRRLKAAAAVLLLVGIVLGARFGWQQLGKGGLSPLPTELEARAQLMGIAWLQNDDDTMRRLTLGAQGRTLKYWLQDHPNPLSGMNQDKSIVGKETNVSLHILNEKRDSVQLVVIVNHPLASSPVSLSQEWVKDGDTWYFKPFPENNSNASRRSRL
jgi:tetratricopeptide (TPR) repeat protein